MTSREQTQGIGQVNTAVQQMDKTTQSAAANAEESASASEELAGQAEQLNAVVRELAALVGGRGGDAGETGGPGRHGARARQRPAVGRGHAGPAEPRQAPAPAALIPFESTAPAPAGDFAAFGQAA